jgi:glycosyltransferase involved in cell wall biosynthesis
MRKICIVTTRHISYNPRVLKEADTFYGNGYDVVVVTINNHELQGRFDEELMRTRKWALKTVDFRRSRASEKSRWLYLSLKQKFFNKLSRLTLHFGVAERAVEKAYDALLSLAKEQHADIYIAHHAEALGIGFAASRSNRSLLGFDAEDFHTGMNNVGSDRIITYLEKKYLPHCTYLTAASKGIGEAYVKKYGTRSPVTILNTFPVWRRTMIPHEPVKFYWYSQVIGPDRGLEVLMEAASRISSPMELHLRGTFNDAGYKDSLLAQTGAKMPSVRIFFHEPILAEEIVADGANFDVGLALESSVSINRDICVTNKILSYLMSGLAVIATDTYGQRDVLSQFPAAGRLCRMNSADELAAAMQYYIDHPDELVKAKTAAGQAADEVFNWENESKKLLNNLRLYLS